MSILRTAARVGVATSVHGRVQRRQRARWAGQHQQAAGASAAQPSVAAATEASGSELLAQLTQLGELRASGVLTQQEFEMQKARLLH
jgi:hypothetical protein